MAKQARGAVLPLLTGQAPDGSKRHALYTTYRQAILSGSLAPGTRLASSRVLAQEYAVARMTVEEALDKLHAEGFLERFQGRGTFVAACLPMPALAGQESVPAMAAAPTTACLSRRAQALAHMPPHPEPLQLRPFNAGLPPLDRFPLDKWRRASAHVLKHHPRRVIGLCAAGGPAPTARCGGRLFAFVQGLGM